MGNCLKGTYQHDTAHLMGWVIKSRFITGKKNYYYYSNR